MQSGGKYETQNYVTGAVVGSSPKYKSGSGPFRAGAELSSPRFPESQIPPSSSLASPGVPSSSSWSRVVAFTAAHEVSG